MWLEVGGRAFWPILRIRRYNFELVTAAERLMVGSYEVDEKLGEGGMGVVYRAHHGVLGNRAAIKILRPSLSAEETPLKRFLAEAKSAAAIQHPGIARVYDVGRTNDGCAYIIMELLEGQTLRERMRQNATMSEATALAFTRQLAAALYAAHRAGIIHRDIKPENIFIVRDEAIRIGERIKLLDFGIAKLTEKGRSENLTRTGDIVGTPKYMSPEQCRGTGSYDARSDLYSVGCVLFEMLCGRPPFEGEFPGDVIFDHIGTEAPLMSTLRAGLSPAVEDLVRQLLAKKPELRIESAERLLVMLDALQEDTTFIEDIADATVPEHNPLFLDDSSRVAAGTPSPAAKSFLPLPPPSRVAGETEARDVDAPLDDFDEPSTIVDLGHSVETPAPTPAPAPPPAKRAAPAARPALATKPQPSAPPSASPSSRSHAPTRPRPQPPVALLPTKPPSGLVLILIVFGLAALASFAMLTDEKGPPPPSPLQLFR